jgi:peptidoglycan/LPS O-acetylase OafA/YrhL
MFAGSSLKTLLPFSLDGKVAVCGFLLISGFSIAHSFLKQKDGFIRRRFLRIYPAYFPSVLWAVGLMFIAGNTQIGEQFFPRVGWVTVAGNILLLQSVVTVTIPFNSPLWSLGVEFSYYLLTPLLGKVKVGWILIAALGSAVLAILNVSLPVATALFVYAWAWLGGYIYVRVAGWISGSILGVGGYVVIYCNNAIFTGRYGIIIWLVCVAMVSINVDVPEWSRKMLNYLGSLSYPLYLIHVPIYILLALLFKERLSVAFAGVVVLAGTVAYMHIFESRASVAFWSRIYALATKSVGAIVTKACA